MREQAKELLLSSCIDRVHAQTRLSVYLPELHALVVKNLRHCTCL